MDVDKFGIWMFDVRIDGGVARMDSKLCYIPEEDSVMD